MESKKKFFPLTNKLIIILLPVMIIAFAGVFLTTFMKTKTILLDDIEKEAQTGIEAIDYHVLQNLNHTFGILENVRISVENGCSTDEEIQNYIYSVADAYPDTIPTGIYCGLESGLYIDKLWTPDSDWIMKERPWYTDGLKADEISLGEMYVDADSGQFIVSVYVNLKGADGNVIGVLAADVPMDSIVTVIQSATIMEGGNIYGVDKTSGLVFGDQTQAALEFCITDSTDALDQKVVSMINSDDLNNLVSYKGQYILINKIEGTNFYIVYEVPENVVNAKLTTVRNASLLSSVIGIILLSIVMGIVVTVMLKPVGKLQEMIFKMEKLDLTGTAQIKSNDEIGHMAAALNDMALNLKEMIGAMQTSIASIDASADSNSETAADLALSSSTQYDAVESLTNTMNEMNRAIEKIAEGATDLAQTVSGTAKEIEDASEMIGQTKNEIDAGRLAMGNMTDTMGAITSVSQDLRDAVDNVQTGVEGIMQMVTVINDIASQTNLLSLNASIEAARAGEAGRGFAVVAEEIRTLSETSANAVSKIRETTDNMDKLVGIVLQKTEESIEAVKQGGAAVGETEQVFNNISDNIEKIRTIMDNVDTAFDNVERVAGEMATGTEQQTTRTNKVLETSRGIQDMSRKFSEDGTEMDSKSRTLKELSGALEEKIGQFRI